MENERDISELLDMLKRRNEELAVMTDIAKTLTSSLDVEEVLSVIMKKITVLLNPKMWSLLLTDEASGELYFKIAVSPVAEELKQIRLKVGEGIAGWVADKAEPLLIRDVRQDERFAQHIDERVDFITRSVICVPMKIKEKVVGVIELVNSLQDDNYDNADLLLLSTIADFAAIAIDNARGYARLNEMVITDELTGLLNARHFNAILDREAALANRYHTKLSLVFFDLDHFKNVNDSYGHLVGSRLLCEVGALVRRTIRTTDFAARFGGDEFVLLLPNTGAEQAYVMVANLRMVLKETVFRADQGEEIMVTGSFGIATYPDDADCKIDLMRCADKAMYMVKEETRDGIHVSNPETIARIASTQVKRECGNG